VASIPSSWFALGFLRGQPVIAEAKKLAEPRIAEENGVAKPASTDVASTGTKKNNKKKKKQ